MKIGKILIIAACAAMIATPITHAESDIKVFVNNDEVTFTDQKPEIIDGRTLVPIRAVFEQAGAEVSWNDATKTATIAKRIYSVDITVGQPYLLANGTPITIDVPATIINDRLAIPIRAISESMGFGVTWNSVRQSILINTDGKTYRANSQAKTGFLELKDAGFISTQMNDLNYYDLDCDEKSDTIGFTPSTVKDDDTITSGRVWINGEEFSKVINPNLNAYAIGVVDLADTDKFNEIVVLYKSEDGNSIGIYRYNGSDLFQMKANNTEDGLIYYNDRVFVDKKENIITDKDGLCFLDSMVCTGEYSVEDSQVIRYRLKTENSKGQTYKRAYNDSFCLSSKRVTDYVNKGNYVNKVIDADTINSDDMVSFKILDCYIDDKEPSNFEFYVLMPDGNKYVIWPYQS